MDHHPSESGLRACPARRDVLRAAGATLFLPWLEALAPKSPSSRTRLVVLFFPNGVLPSAWSPTGEGAEFELSPTLAPLERFKSEILVLSGLSNAQSRDGDGHYAKSAPLLTGCKIRRTGGQDLWNGVSMDQVAAASLGGRTPIPSLELGTEAVRTVEDMGYSTVYGGHIAWRTPNQPMPKEIRPRAVFDRLFRAGRLRQPGAKRVLDLVRDEARALGASLPASDRAKLAEYEDAVDALERRIDAATAADAAPAASATLGTPEEGVPRNFPDHVKLMFDLVHEALRTDTTRIVTFMFGNAVSGRDFSFVDGVRGGHHDLSHHENNPEKQRQYQLINRWHVEQLAGFLDRLRSTREGDATLLDRTLVLFLGSLRDGNTHEPRDLPVVLAGGRETGLSLGRHLRFDDPTPLCNLHLALLQRLGLDLRSFGDGTKPLF